MIPTTKLSVPSLVSSSVSVGPVRMPRIRQPKNTRQMTVALRAIKS